MERSELVAAARAQVGQFAPAQEWLTAGSVAAALVTEAGNLVHRDLP